MELKLSFLKINMIILEVKETINFNHYLAY